MDKFPLMTPAELRAARERLGLTQDGLAKALRMGKHGGRNIRRLEAGQYPISGPIAVAVELMLEIHNRRQPDEGSTS